MYKVLACILAMALAAPVMADGPLTVQSSMLAVKKQAAADGTTKVSLVPAARMVPGDKVILRLSYHNAGTAPISQVVLSNPLPKGIAYRAVQAGSPAPDLSVDGRTFGPLAALSVVTADGRKRAATADDITQVRWRLASAVPAGGQGQLSIEAVLK